MSEKRVEIEDVPIPTRARCQECGTEAGLEQLKVIEHLLGGWFRAHCPNDGGIQVWRPVKEETHRD